MAFTLSHVFSKERYVALLIDSPPTHTAFLPFSSSDFHRAESNFINFHHHFLISSLKIWGSYEETVGIGFPRKNDQIFICFFKKVGIRAVSGSKSLQFEVVLLKMRIFKFFRLKICEKRAPNAHFRVFKLFSQFEMSNFHQKTSKNGMKFEKWAWLIR